MYICVPRCKDSVDRFQIQHAVEDDPPEFEGPSEGSEGVGCDVSESRGDGQ